MNNYLKYVFIVLMFLSTVAKAQDKTKGFELGVRVGTWTGSGAAVDAMFPVGKNRIHADLGSYKDAFVLSGFFDWKFPIAEGFWFYPGPGFELGSVHQEFAMGIGCELGFEYAFKIPLSIGLDWRPVFGVVYNDGFNYNSVGLNIRYRF